MPPHPTTDLSFFQPTSIPFSFVSHSTFGRPCWHHKPSSTFQPATRRDPSILPAEACLTMQSPSTNFNSPTVEAHSRTFSPFSTVYFGHSPAQGLLIRFSCCNLFCVMPGNGKLQPLPEPANRPFPLVPLVHIILPCPLFMPFSAQEAMWLDGRERTCHRFELFLCSRPHSHSHTHTPLYMASTYSHL